MKTDQFENIGLPKWPALLVRGEKITPEQAKTILIRTDDFMFGSNDDEFVKQLQLLVYGVPTGSHELTERYRRQEAIRREIGVLPISYLHNSRIVSAWIGGPHGWCDWDGTIGSNNYNIGKWPGIDAVTDDWKVIAEAFPFLDLTSQLLDKEICEEGAAPVIEFRVKDGKVTRSIPTTLIDQPNDENTDAFIGEMLFNPYRERGCTIERFADALNYVKACQTTNV